jgi:dienelactone hydrolase
MLSAGAIPMEETVDGPRANRGSNPLANQRFTLLEDYELRVFQYDSIKHEVYSKGNGPVIVVFHELPGLVPPVINFANRLVASGFHVYLPHLFGPLLQRAAVRNLRALCLSDEFGRLRAGISSPVTSWLRGLVDDLGAQQNTGAIGVIGMCVTGAFVIPMIMSPHVKAVVAAQPAVPFSLTYAICGIGRGRWEKELNICDAELAGAAKRVQEDRIPVLALRFESDRVCVRGKLDRFKEAFGDCVELSELPCGSWVRRVAKPPHSVLTEEYDRASESTRPTRAAFNKVVSFFNSALRQSDWTDS